MTALRITHLHTSDHAQPVTVHDLRTGHTWAGWLDDGLVVDGSGFIGPEDIGWRFQITTEKGADITDDLAGRR